MRTVNFDLKPYKNKKITGELVLEIPGYRERLRIMKDCNFKVDGSGTSKINTEAIDNLLNVIDATEKYFKKIDLKCGDISAKTFEELEDYPEFTDIINDAAAYILYAGKLGK